MTESNAPQTIPGNALPVNRPDFKRPEYVALQPVRRLSRAFMAGTRAVRALGEEALPKWPGEEADFYRLRATIAQVTRYYARTIEALVGMVSGSPPTLADGTDPRIVADWEDIDRRGRHGDVFVRDLTQEMAVGGFAAILVDTPPVPDGLRLTLDDEQKMGLRPYWVLLAAEQILSWIVEAPDWRRLMDDFEKGLLTAEDVGRLSTQEVLRQVVLYEPSDANAGEFGVQALERYRVLRLSDTGVEFRVWEKRKGEGAAGDHFVLVSSGPMLGAGRTRLPAIPLAIAYPKRPDAPFVSEPAMYAVCEQNIDHYQLTADRRYLIKHTHSPTLYLFGVESERDEAGFEKPIRVGPNRVIRSSNPEAKAGYLSAPSESLAASKDERDEVVRQIAALGQSFIAKDRQNGTETARGRELDLAAEHATHRTMARGVQDALEQALGFHALHRDCPAPSVQMHPATPAPHVDPQLVAQLWQAVVTGRLDLESWLHFLRTGTLPEDLDLSSLTVKLLAEMEAMRETDALRADPHRGESLGGDADGDPDEKTSQRDAA